MSSSSEDDDFQERLRETVLGSELGLQSSQTSVKSIKSEKPSLRYIDSDDEDRDKSGPLTAGFKKHMAKKLSAYLDEQIEEINPNHDAIFAHANSTCNDGFRLLATSVRGAAIATYDEMEAAEAARAKRQNRRKSPSTSSGSEDSDEELDRLASAAVSGEFIVEKGSLASAGSSSASRDPVCRSDDLSPRQPIASADDACSTSPGKQKKKKKRHEEEAPVSPLVSKKSVPCESSLNDTAKSVSCANSMPDEQRRKKKKKQHVDCPSSGTEEDEVAPSLKKAKKDQKKKKPKKKKKGRESISESDSS